MQKNPRSPALIKQMISELADRQLADYSDYRKLVLDVHKMLPRHAPGVAFGVGRHLEDRVQPLKKDDLVLPIENRPVVWHDLLAYQTQFERTNQDVVTDFGFSSVNYCVPKMETSKSGLQVMQRSYDILYRIYMVYPGPYPWPRINFIDAFDVLYEGIVSSMDITLQQKQLARRALQARFTAMFGISASTGYRWFEPSCRPTQHQASLLRKLVSLKSPLAALETIAMVSVALRGGDLNALAPIPTTQSLLNAEPISAPRRSHLRAAVPADYAGGSFG